MVTVLDGHHVLADPPYYQGRPIGLGALRVSGGRLALASPQFSSVKDGPDPAVARVRAIRAGRGSYPELQFPDRRLTLHNGVMEEPA
jgi:hypothetical protein